MENEWIEVAVEIPGGSVEDVSIHLINMGSNGVVTDTGDLDAFEIPEESKERVEIKAYFISSSAPEKIKELRAFLEGQGLEFGIRLTNVSETDWANKWKEFFRPEKITDRIVVKPAWESYEPREGEVVIEIDPGMAFGTGTHPTTRMCLRLIEEVISENAVTTMLDVGTGSGILSIAAAKLGVERTIAIDNDKTAIAVAEENILKNRVDASVRAPFVPLKLIRVVFNLVVANIIAEEIIKLSDELRDRVAAGGSLILSGILAGKAGDVKEAFKDLTLMKEVFEGEWVALLFRREG